MKAEQTVGMSLVLATLISFGMSGCGGSGSNDTVITTPSVKQVSGIAIDGYLSKAKVCIDINANSKCDVNEPTTTTDVDGKFSISTELTNLSQYSVLVEAVPGVTVDSDNNTIVQKAFFLKANASEPEVISPITTLIQNNLELNASLTKADVIAQIKRDLNVSDNINITGDYIAKKVDVDSVVYGKIHTVARVLTKAIATTLDTNTNITDTNYNASTKIMFADIATNIKKIATDVDKDTFNEDSYEVTVVVNNTKVTELEKKIGEVQNIENPVTDNRIIKVVKEVFIGNWTMNTDFTYNSEGLLIKKSELQEGEGGDTWETTYTYDAHNNITETINTAFGESSKHSITNTYNEAGILIKVESGINTTIYNNDKTIAKELSSDRNTTYQYTNGLLTSKFTTFSDFTLYYPSGTRFLSIINGEKPAYLTMLTEYEYDGTKLKTVNAYEYNKENATVKKLAEVQTYAYNANGDVTLVSINADNFGGELIQLTAYNYDASTNKLKRVLVSDKKSKYNDENEIIDYYDIKDTMFKYDENLNLTEKAISYYERENSIDGNVTFSEKTIYTWDYIK